MEQQEDGEERSASPVANSEARPASPVASSETNNDEEQPSTSKAAAQKQNDAELKDDDLDNIVSAEEYLQQRNIVLLAYEKQMFLDMVHADALMVCAKGLHYDRVLLNILKVYCDAGNLILIIHASDWEEQYYKSKLEPKYVHEVASTAAERERVYLEGGIQFISTRILVVDLLKQRIPIELISGIVVLRAHSIVESCQEAFALRLYRQTNKTGFIKAFSNSPEAFTIGYGHIERTMRNLFVKELYIWPRFHAIVQRALRPYEAQSVELHVPMSAKMKLIQTHILDIMNYLVKEVKRINRTVDMEEITVENCVTKKFHKILQAQLEYIWHQLSSQTKLIVADLKILRNLMISTIYHDSVSAFALVKRYRSTEYALSNSGWTLLDSAEQIFKLSKERVYNEQGEFDPEPCPKWKILSEILKTEIPADRRRKQPDTLEPPKVLILCQDARSCYQLRQFLTQSGERFLLYTAMRNDIPIGKLSKNYENIDGARDIELFASQQKNDSKEAKSKKPQNSLNNKETENESTADGKQQLDELSQLLLGGDEQSNLDLNNCQESYFLTMTQSQFNESNFLNESENVGNMTAAAADAADCSIFEPFPELENLDITAAVSARKQPLICLQTFKTEREGAMGLDRVLEEIAPHYVIMYHCNVTAIRQLEIYEARLRRPAKERMSVFFLLHARTVEEQSYLTSLRREKQAFELIIDTKSKMVIPEYQDGKTDEAFILYKPYMDLEEDDSANAKTRKAGGQQATSAAEKLKVYKVIVDMREFRSDLPCLIHKQGMEVVPVTITIGDYILTPEICVERKSISDLIGSLNSGRLYNQCIQMQRYYAKPILLIEFDQNKPFHLQGKYMISQSTTTSNANIVQKLQLLTLHFPKLRLIWSPSPYATAQLFYDLKVGKPDPDPSKAAQLGSDEAGAYDELKFNANIYDFLLRLPGINTKNVHRVMRRGGSLKQLLKMTQSELCDLLDSEANGKMLWDILHVAHLPDKDEVQGSTVMLAAGKPVGSHSRFRRGAAAATSGRGRKF